MTATSDDNSKLALKICLLATCVFFAGWAAKIAEDGDRPKKEFCFFIIASITCGAGFLYCVSSNLNDFAVYAKSKVKSFFERWKNSSGTEYLPLINPSESAIGPFSKA